MNEFLKIFEERGFLHQATDKEGLAALPSFTAYIGFDLTANSLHVGSLLQIMILRWLKKTENTPIILLGGATTKVGDPSGKDESRPVITDETIAKNKAGIAGVFAQFGLGDAKVVDNSEWLDGVGHLDFLREVGRHFSVNRMIAKESVKSRLDRESQMSFLEFNYMTFQAYDFVKLADKYNCNLQIGGSDQWGNIVEGIDLHRRINVQKKQFKELDTFEFSSNHDENKKGLSKLDYNIKIEYSKTQIFGLTTPLITTSSGAKMGKTADGAVWLSAEKTSPYEYYQFWRNADDADVIRFLKFFTELDVAEIEAMKKWEGSSQINEAKKILAFEATKICHGEAQAIAAQEAAVNAFELGTTQGLPEMEVEAKTYAAFELFAAVGLAESNGKARKLIQGGGARIDDEKVTDENAEIIAKDGMKISSGKKNHIILRLK